MLLATPDYRMATGIAVAFFIFIVALFILAVVLIRKSARTRQESSDDSAKLRVDSGNASAFMTASMQGVIEKLRQQEQELARLHQLEKARAEETEKLSEAVTRNMPAGLLLIGATGMINSANPAAEEALGIRNLQYRRFSEALGEDSPLARMLDTCLREGRTFQRDEIPHTNPAGEPRRLGVTISPIYKTVRNTLSEGFTAAPVQKVIGALCLMSDITELASLQKQMRWKENLAALGEMSAGIAHEFKNALATISGYAQMVRSDAASDEMRENAAKILDQTRSLSHVVTEFLRFARPLEFAQEDFSLVPLVEQVANEVSGANPALEICSQGDFGEISGDSGLIRQALLNLARNAAEAASSNSHPGEIIITGFQESQGHGQWQRISFCDNGPGIAEADLPKLFVPFFTTKSSGTGLGLALVQKIVLQHGGRVEAHNRSSGGAQFDLWLPLKQHARA